MIKDDKKDKDNELQKAGVTFLPFVGDEYWNGISFDDDGNLVLEGQGKKVLVLGESHYCDGDCCDCGNFKLHKECAEFTRNVINEYLDESKERQNWMRTFLKFERALSNTVTKSEDRKKIWNHLMFYNYLQHSLHGARMAGSSKDYEDAAAPFFAILEMYKPDYVIVWGRRLFENLPYACGVKGENVPSIDMNSWSYHIENHTIKILPVAHPSVGFSWGYWHEYIVEFFK
ncbi:hypothetical protein [Prevotella merdae]|uniref:hypothetical protein n=1 Tax=Prevotella merdae TaxID=2079531 RepID=UPI00356AEB0A